METATATQIEQPKNVVLCDVPRSGNDVYRISRNVYKGERYVDIRIFFRSKADATLLVPTTKGVCFPEKIREEYAELFAPALRDGLRNPDRRERGGGFGIHGECAGQRQRQGAGGGAAGDRVSTS